MDQNSTSPNIEMENLFPPATEPKKKPKRKKKEVQKIEIGYPTDFKHVGHVGHDEVIISQGMCNPVAAPRSNIKSTNADLKPPYQDRKIAGSSSPQLEQPRPFRDKEPIHSDSEELLKESEDHGGDFELDEKSGYNTSSNMFSIVPSPADRLLHAAVDTSQIILRPSPAESRPDRPLSDESVVSTAAGCHNCNCSFL